MKKIILSVAAILAFGFANAQESESTGSGFANGDIFITGTVGISSAKTGDFKANTFEVAPAVGLFVSENIAIGATIGYGSEKLSFGSADAQNSTVTAGAFARYYATPASAFSFFGHLGFTYQTTDNEFGTIDGEIIEVEGKTNGFEIAVRPGVSYFISDNFALEASIGALSYTTSKPDFDGAESTDTFEVNVDLSQIQFGLLYKF